MAEPTEQKPVPVLSVRPRWLDSDLSEAAVHLHRTIPIDLGPSSPLCRADIAISALHLNALGHFGPWGSCAPCREIVLTVDPSLDTYLGDQKTVWAPRIKTHSSTTLWRKLVWAAGVTRLAIPLNLDHPMGSLPDDDVHAFIRAIDGGRKDAVGDLSYFDHHRHQRDNGRTEGGTLSADQDETVGLKSYGVDADLDDTGSDHRDLPTTHCTDCVEWAGHTWQVYDKRKPKDGRARHHLEIMADRTMTSRQIQNSCIEGPRGYRVARGHAVRPDGPLPMATKAMLATIEEWPGELLEALIGQVRWEVADPGYSGVIHWTGCSDRATEALLAQAIKEEQKAAKAASREPRMIEADTMAKFEDAADAERAWLEILEVASRHPKADKELNDLLIKHLNASKSTTPLLVTRDDGSEVVRNDAEHSVGPGAADLTSDIIDQARLTVRRPGVTLRNHVETATVMRLRDMFEDQFGSGDVDLNTEMLMSYDGFDGFVEKVLEYFEGDTTGIGDVA